MAKASPAKNVFEGEFSPLAQGRTDLERYPRSMRGMLNFVTAKQGPAIRRSGTQFGHPARVSIDVDEDDRQYSALIPFQFNESEVLQMEFSHLKLRWHYQYDGLLANEETAPTVVVANNPVKITIPGHVYVVDEYVTFQDFPSVYSLNDRVLKVTAVAGDDVTFDLVLPIMPTGAIPGTPYAARVYEIDTPYQAKDVRKIRARQWLDTVYLFCDGYRPQVLQRYALFDWRLRDMKFKDGPYLPINDTNTRLVPQQRGTWIPIMTANNAPSGEAVADTEAATHEAFRAFDAQTDSYWEPTTPQKGILEYKFIALANQIPLMTGPTTGGVTMSSSTDGGAGSVAWKARDGNNDTDWRSADSPGGDVPQWLQIDFGVNKTIQQYTLRASRNRKEFAMRDWTLSGAAAPGGPYTVVDTRINVKWKSGEKIVFTVAAPAAFRYYRINVTQVNRIDVTVTIPAVGKPGKPGYQKKKTITTRSDPRVAIANIEMFDAVGIPRIVDGYCIQIARRNEDDKPAKNYAPSTWTFEGYDGSNWTILDSQQDYTDYADRRSEYFEIQNENAYQSYRINIKECVGNGNTVMPRIAQLNMSSPDSPNITWTATSTVGINKDVGFLPTDVGRVLRVQGHDKRWRWFEITSVIDDSTFTAQMKESEPFVYPKSAPLWRLGMFSDTTGWPIDGAFFEDRLWVGGAKDYPDTVASSRVGSFERFRTSSPRDVVLDDHGINVRMLSNRLSRIKWMSADMQGVLVGTGVGEFTISSPDNEALTARNIKARPISRRGSFDLEPVTVDDRVFNVQYNRRSLNVLSYQSNRDSAGYTNPSISALASHLAFPFVEQIAYAQEPYGIVWGRRQDGSVIAVTYDTEGDTIGGHRHDFGGFVEYISVLPSPVDGQDTLWMVIRRNIDGQEYRFIEWLVKYWDFGDTIDLDAQYVDCSLRYLGTTPQSHFYGAYQLAGSVIDVLADGVQYRDIPVDANGHILLPNPATFVVGGIRMKAEGEIQSIEAGAADGTAQGKVKRPNLVVASLWDSYGGHVGRYNDDNGEKDWTPIEYPENYGDLDPVTLQTCFTQPLILPMGYGPRGSISFYTDDLYPLNIIALLPQINTQDR